MAARGNAAADPTPAFRLPDPLSELPFDQFEPFQVIPEGRLMSPHRFFPIEAREMAVDEAGQQASVLGASIHYRGFYD